PEYVGLGEGQPPTAPRGALVILATTFSLPSIGATRSRPRTLSSCEEQRVRIRMKIMIVEDDSLLALALEEQLRLAGHEIVGPLYDYGEALTRATDERPEVAIVDGEIPNAEARTNLIWSFSGL